jgi:tetratricopeptide (TPR) repeat protein
MLIRCLIACLSLSLLLGSFPVEAAPGKKRPKPPARKTNTSKKPAPRKADKVNIGPMVFTFANGKIKSIQQLSAQELLKLGYQKFGQKRYKVSTVLYKRLLKYFPMHKNSYAALYNLALSLEEQKRYAEAIKQYERFISLYKEKKNLILNARFRMGSCYGQLKQWTQAFKVYDKVLQGDISVSDRYEALAYAGEARYRSGKPRLAKPLLTLAVRLYDRQPVQKRDVSYAVAMSQYYLARMADKKFRKQGFHFPLKRLKEDLETKARFFLDAQRMYLKAVRLGSIDWSMASLFSIGKMYEQLYYDMMNAPYPKDLTKEQKAVYTRLLRKRIQNLLRKAMWLYQHSLNIAKRLGIKEGVWTAKAEDSLKQVFSFYKKTFGKKASLPGNMPTSRPAPKAAKQAPAARQKTPSVRTAPSTRPAAPTSRPTAR